MPGFVIFKFLSQAKWRFNDLTNRKIVALTCERHIEYNDEMFVWGKVETILDPVVNVGQEVWMMGKLMEGF